MIEYVNDGGLPTQKLERQYALTRGELVEYDGGFWDVVGIRDGVATGKRNHYIWVRRGGPIQKLRLARIEDDNLPFLN